MMNDWAGLPANYSDVLRRAMESLFRTFENFSEGTFIVDADSRVVWINKRYAARFGFADRQADSARYTRNRSRAAGGDASAVEGRKRHDRGCGGFCAVRRTEGVDAA